MDSKTLDEIIENKNADIEHLRQLQDLPGWKIYKEILFEQIRYRQNGALEPATTLDAMVAQTAALSERKGLVLATALLDVTINELSNDVKDALDNLEALEEEENA